ncbi:MAG: sigma-70 family RNA polymerase sigma factor [Bryobacterales bacterium]|nr:sigma-70 family RNA polymerase sigma factor [Bryobacterales bacterium]MBV9397368.1 sigma-70 family RNA polymerase sigma factor [Bryobacterales bacterium]
MRADGQAFAALVKKHQAMVFSIAWNYLHNEALAEDIAQEAFLELHRRLPQIESDLHATNFLRKVAAHRSMDEGRRRRSHPQVAIADIAEPAALPRRADPLLEGALSRLVNSLPDRSRMIVILRYQEDLDPAEIAAVLDIPLGTVKSNLHRALLVLRKRMQRKWKGAVQ